MLLTCFNASCFKAREMPLSCDFQFSYKSSLAILGDNSCLISTFLLPTFEDLNGVKRQNYPSQVIVQRR